MAASFIETGATATLHAMCATALGTLLDTASARFYPAPAALAPGEAMPSITQEIKQALMLLVQFNMGIMATSNMMSLVLPAVESGYRSPIGGEIWSFFFFYHQPTLRRRSDVLVQSIISKLRTATDGLFAANDAPPPASSAAAPAPGLAIPVADPTPRRNRRTTSVNQYAL